MLGIRQFKNCRVDIWVGDSQSFTADQTFSTVEDITDVSELHISLCMGHNDFESSILSLKAHLDLINCPRRVTLILENKDNYLILRDLLEAHFDDIL